MDDNDGIDLNDETFEGDELMQEVAKPPEFPAARSEQIEQTWTAIVGHLEADAPTRAEDARPASVPAMGWFERLFPTAPAWSPQLAGIAALLIVGFGAAWIAAGLGVLPGAVSTDVASGPDVAAEADPDRAWMAASDYSDRLEALLLGVSRGAESGAADVGPVAREASRELLTDNRFYQRVARRNEDPVATELLSRIEIILLALATVPEGQEQEVMQMLRDFIDESNVLTDLREVRSSVPRMPRPAAMSTGS